MARRRARHRLAPRLRGRPAAHAGQPPALHAIPHRDDPHSGTDNPHSVTDDDHQGAAAPSAATAHHAAGHSDLDADHGYPDPHPQLDPDPHPHPQLDPDRDPHPDAAPSAANDGRPGADPDDPDRRPDAPGPDEHPDAAAGPG